MKDVVLLADPNTPAFDFANKIHNHILSSYNCAEFPVYPIDVKIFRNSESLPYVDKNIREKDVYFIQSSNKDPDKWWTELLKMKDLCLSASARGLTYVLPHMHYLRQDRKHKSRVPISARALASSISSEKIKRVITMDMHAPQIQGFFPDYIPIDNLYSFPEVVKYVRDKHYSDLENLVIVSPDAGGVERGMSFLKRMVNANKSDNTKHNYDFAFTHKIRSEPGEIGKMWFVGDVNKKNTLILDDILDSGGTFRESAKLLKKNGAEKILIYATHALFTKGTKEGFDDFSSIMVGNTHYFSNEPHEKIEVIDITPIFAEAIYRAQKGLSISELFD